MSYNKHTKKDEIYDHDYIKLLQKSGNRLVICIGCDELLEKDDTNDDYYFSDHSYTNCYYCNDIYCIYCVQQRHSRCSKCYKFICEYCIDDSIEIIKCHKCCKYICTICRDFTNSICDECRKKLKCYNIKKAIKS